MPVMPQFPLGTVLFPTMLLPLHIFEPRYRAMIRDVMEGDRRFGVVLIERGHETGGDDQRSLFGTVAEVMEAEEFPDGRWAVVTVGTERIKIGNWLPDDPYPMAEVEPWPDLSCEGPVPADAERVEAKLRRCIALASEAGVDVGRVPDRFDHGPTGTMQMAAMLPVGSFDKQRMLGAPDAVARLSLIEQAVDEAVELVELQLRGG
jgi:Lon protease-like protein